MCFGLRWWLIRRRERALSPALVLTGGISLGKVALIDCTHEIEATDFDVFACCGALCCGFFD